MANNFNRLVSVFWALVLVAASGCNRAAKAPPSISIEQVPQALESAFQGASSEATTAAVEAATAVRSDEPAVALEMLQDLSARPELTDEQRATAGRALTAYLQKAREAAEKGDKKSEDALQQYRATK